MYVLMHNNVDNYPSNWDKWKSKPTEKQLRNLLSDYYDGKTLDNLVSDLVSYGSANAENSACDQFEIQEL